MELNSFGIMVEKVWNDLPNHYAHVALDQFIVMPNHMHGIIFLIDEGPVGAAGLKPAPTGTPGHQEAAMNADVV